MNENATIAHNSSRFHAAAIRPDWLIPFIINVALTIATLYTLISIIHYGLKTKKWSSNNASASNITKLNAGIVYTFLIFTALMCLFRYVASLVHMSVGFAEDQGWLCEGIADVAFIAYSLVLWCVFTFLWLRQRAFYTNRMLSFGTTRIIRALSFGSIILITFSGFGYMLFFTIPKNYDSSPMGCIYIADKNFRLGYGIYVIALLFLSQVMLLCLFTYPVWKMHRLGHATKKSITPSLKTMEESESTQRSQGSITPLAETSYQPKIKDNLEDINRNKKHGSFSIKPPSNEIKNILTKTLIFALLSTTLDVFLQIFTKYATDGFSHRRFNIILFDTAAFLNLLFLVFSFVTAKNILFSFCYK